MSLDLFKTIHAEVKDHAWRLTFYMEGEPMMNPRLFDMVEIATRDPYTFTSFSTNFTLMREELLLPLFRSRIDWISVSLDGFTQETYEKYRVNGNVATVLNGIAMTTRFKSAHKLSYPYVQVNMITFSHVSVDEMRALESFCAESKVDEFRLRPDQTGLLGPYTRTAERQPSRRCHWPWTSLSVDVDGAVYACPIAFEQHMSYGNLGTTRLDDIWNNELYVATRAYLSREGDDRRVCQRCLATIADGTESVSLRKIKRKFTGSDFERPQKEGWSSGATGQWQLRSQFSNGVLRSLSVGNPTSLVDR